MGFLWPIILLVGALGVGAVASVAAYALNLAEGSGAYEAEFKNVARAQQEALDAFDKANRSRIAEQQSRESTEVELVKVNLAVKEFEKRESEKPKDAVCDCGLGDVIWPWDTLKGQ